MRKTKLRTVVVTAVCGAALPVMLITPATADAAGATRGAAAQQAGTGTLVQGKDYLGFSMIKSARWVWHSPNGYTLEVTPTGWSRANAGSYVAGASGWSELYSKYKNRGLNTNLDGMRDQYICHQQIVAIRSPRKATWNLDEWRPNVSYPATVNASCNPGGSKWFD